MSFLPVFTVEIRGPNNRLTGNGKNRVGNTSSKVHLPNDTLTITFENTVFLLIPKENATVSIGYVLKMHARSHCQ
jgi:hypothetical protein